MLDFKINWAVITEIIMALFQGWALPPSTSAYKNIIVAPMTRAAPISQN